MHLIAAVDTESSMHINFVRWLASREYKNNPSRWNVKVREIKLYDLVLPKQIESQVLSELKFFDGSCAGTLGELPNILLKINKFLPLLPKSLEIVNMKDIQAKQFKDLNLPYNEKSFWANVQILGKLKDTENAKGEELL